MATTTVTTQRGRTFTVRLVRTGDAYGRDMQLTHDKPQTLVEFYDYNQADKPAFAPHGQFIARYYAGTLLEREAGTGMSLHLGIPEWLLDAATMDQVMDWLCNQL
jgi:hypothetical protein